MVAAVQKETEADCAIRALYTNRMIHTYAHAPTKLTYYTR